MTTPTLNPRRALRALAVAIGGTLAAAVVVLGSLLAAAIALFVLVGGARRTAGVRTGERRRANQRPRPVPSLGPMGLGPALARLRR
jgi:hypothetical protein